ncbi:MAG: hypothetical protein ABI354_02025 [Candidatus Saccharimonadales bacterium]
MWGLSNKKVLLWGGLLVVLIFIILLSSHAFTPKTAVQLSSKNPAPATLAGIQNSAAPWPAEVEHLSERLDAMGLPKLKNVGTALHIHPHVDIFIDGQPVTIPPGVGINMADGFIAAIHTYDTSGVLHIQPATVRTFTLGQFFDTWGVDFTSKRIGIYQTDSNKTLKVFLNGKQYPGDPQQPILKDSEEIVVAYGTEQELPNPIPSEYILPPGY